MTDYYASPKLVKRQFNLELGQAFLLRPLTPLEIEIVDHWIDFYSKENKSKKKNLPASALQTKFRKYLAAQGYDAGLFDVRAKEKGILLFQGLFKASPQIDFLTAVKRCTGNEINVSELEARLAFREFAINFLYYRPEARFERRLPNFEDIQSAHESKLFLANTGIILLSKHIIKHRDRPFKTNEICLYYAYYFDLPREISFELLEAVMPSEKNLQALSERLKQIVDAISIEFDVALPVLVLDGADLRDNYFKLMTYASNLFKYINSKDPELRTNMELFTKDFNKIDQVPKNINCANGNVVIKHIPVKLNWTPKEIRENFIEAWKASNPYAYIPEDGVLIDPPSTKKLIKIREIQLDIVKRLGYLDEEECERLNVSTIPVISSPEITKKYPGGYQQLLRDIENMVWPSIETDDIDIARNDNGITFTDKRQLKGLVNAYINNERSFEESPRAVVRGALFVISKQTEHADPVTNIGVSIS